MRFSRLLLAAFCVIAASVVGSLSDEPRAEAQFFSSIDITRSGPLGPITVFGDSVLLGSGLTSPTLPDHLAARGWGPIRFHTGVGFNTGFPNRGPDGAKATFWFDRWKSQGWDAKNVVINLGANDSFNCPDIACMRNQILGLVDHIGPGHHIWWPQITLQPHRRAEQDRWNAALAQIAAERADFDTWNWPAEMAAGRYSSSDNIHLTASGYRQRSAHMALVITARLGEGRRGGAPATLPEPTAEPSRFVPVTQQRLVDTRTDPAPVGGRRQTGEVLRVDLDGVVPDGTTAVALYLAATDTRSGGYLSAAPCGQTTETSSVNFSAFDTRGGPTITQVGSGGDVCITVKGDAHIVVDLHGAFHPDDPSGLSFDPLPEPERYGDTRDTGRASTIRLTAPPGARAVAINLAAVGAATRGNLRAAPCGTTPLVASLNYRPGAVIAASTIVEVGTDGTFCVTSSSSVDVVVDVTGSFSPTGELRFVPVVPTRTLDTRFGIGGWTTFHGADQVIDAPVAPPSAAAVTGSLFAVRPLMNGRLTAAPCGTTPPTASLNASSGVVVANSFTGGITDGELCIVASTGMQTVFDTTGWWIAD